ncbi:MAG: Rab family GTPase [Promethearchaeota archaeon]
MHIKEEYILKVVIVGPFKVGKTNLVHRYTQGYFLGDAATTIGVDFALKRVNAYLTDQKDSLSSICLQLWDFAGQLHYEFILPHYVKGTHMVILAFDATNIKTFEMLPRWLKTVREHISEVPIILVSTKNDLGKTIPDKTIDEFMNKENIDQVFHTSSKTGENIDKLFRYCVNYAIELINSQRLQS